MGVIFNTRDVGVCLAEVKGASAMMRVLFLIPVMCVWVARFRDMPHKSSMGVIFNTRVMEEGCPL